MGGRDWKAYAGRVGNGSAMCLERERLAVLLLVEQKEREHETDKQ